MSLSSESFSILLGESKAKDTDSCSPSELKNLCKELGTDDWVKLRYTMEFYSAMKRSAALTFAVTWMDSREYFIVRQIREGHISDIISLISVISKIIKMNVFTK